MDSLCFLATTCCTVYLTRRESLSIEASLLRSLKDGTSRDSKERVCTVTPDNVPTARGHLRSEMRLQNLFHRATYILVRHASTVLVQKRSMLKDYCPGKLDPTPGGVVGFGESYDLNAMREIQEEMGIDISEGNPSNNSMNRMFTFSYQDSRVRVWGTFYEVEYNGSIEDLKLQEEEVDEVLSMTLEELEQRLHIKPDDFLPDSSYAIKLYFQRSTDLKVNRRLLREYSSGDLDNYGLRTKPKVIFFDCDDTLYFDGWKTANKLTANIEQWCIDKLGLAPGTAYGMYKQYGTALRGLLAEGYIENNAKAIDAFLEEVHDLPMHQLLEPDSELREILLKMDPTIPKYIFTASVSHHAERCIKALGIDDIFEDVVIDVKKCDLETKHSHRSFNAAMEIAGVNDPEACIFLDDSVKNIEAARKIGWRSVLVGKVGRDCGQPISTDHAELVIDRIHDIERVLPELF